MEKEIIVVILLTYKDTELIKPLLDTIKEDYVDTRIVILDNGSTESTWKSLNEINDPRTTLIRTFENLGYTGGINFAVTYALNSISNFKNFFIINPDAKCTPNLISNLSRILNSDTRIACVSPKILSLERKMTYSGGKINLRKGIVDHIVYTDNQYPQESYEVDAYTGCAVLFDASKFKTSGMLNEDLFIYYDEAESSLKLKSKNLKILYAPALEVYHDTSYTMRKVSYLKTYYMTRNKFIVFNSSMGFFNKLYFIAFEFAYHIKNKRVKNAFYHLKGVYDFIKGKKGAFSK
ncbi:MAG: glycosyltransferase family 2 protein [Ferruginibacter sp.]